MNAVIITGANGNIGSKIAENLLQNGSNVLLLYNQNRQRIDKLSENYPEQTLSLQCDIRDLTTLQPAIKDSLAAKGWFAVSLIHTAAMRSTDHSSLVESNSALWYEVIDSNIMGTYNVLKVVINVFLSTRDRTVLKISDKRDDFFRIVLLGSDVSRIGLPYGSAYAASKAAVSNIARTLSVEHGKDMIMINTISPGPVNIDDTHFSEEYRAFRNDYYRKMLSQIPLKRLAEAEDISGLAIFLISEENRYITGEEFFVTGGKR